MNIDASSVSAWTAVLALIVTVISIWFGHWSKKQDRAIKDVQDKIDSLRYQTGALRRYIRELLHIMKKHSIEYPTPPDSFYDTDPKYSYNKYDKDG